MAKNNGFTRVGATGAKFRTLFTVPVCLGPKSQNNTLLEQKIKYRVHDESDTTARIDALIVGNVSVRIYIHTTNLFSVYVCA